MELEKKYYSISETAEMFKVNTSLLRYWEKEFDVLKPYKNKKGDRYFTQDDIRNLQIIYNLTKIKGYTLQGAKDALKQDYQRHYSQSQAVASLLRIKAKLLEIKENLS
ncbi:MAG: MerR family transcriptional regulator [Bacteroidales bacterium]|jgi:DNA-binding transcriptional MerR regulator|nr:MerR family transcriptional regulator [Bacteroidales bacterium]MDD4395006.1 MerR family transcriptional regulator [Bacteroidales bacterium]